MLASRPGSSHVIDMSVCLSVCVPPPNRLKLYFLNCKTKGIAPQWTPMDSNGPNGPNRPNKQTVPTDPNGTQCTLI